MNLESLLQAGLLCSDLEVVDSHFAEIGISDLAGLLHLKSALVTLANLKDFENTVRPSYKENPKPSTIIKPLRKNLEFSKYLRNNFVGHIHPELLEKAVEWQPFLRHVASNHDDPNAMLMANLWILETAINTYVREDSTHKIFDSETDLCYPPDWVRFVDFLEVTIRGSIEYLKNLQAIWRFPILQSLQDKPDFELAIRAGKTAFKFLKL